MPSFGFKLPIFIFAAVAAFAQTAPSPPAPPKHMPANANPAFDAASIIPGESGTKTMEVRCGFHTEK
jgi:hypothetical protein